MWQQKSGGLKLLFVRRIETQHTCCSQESWLRCICWVFSSMLVSTSQENLCAVLQDVQTPSLFPFRVIVSEYHFSDVSQQKLCNYQTQWFWFPLSNETKQNRTPAGLSRDCRKVKTGRKETQRENIHLQRCSSLHISVAWGTTTFWNPAQLLGLASAGLSVRPTGIGSGAEGSQSSGEYLRNTSILWPMFICGIKLTWNFTAFPHN